MQQFFFSFATVLLDHGGNSPVWVSTTITAAVLFIAVIIWLLTHDTQPILKEDGGQEGTLQDEFVDE